MKIQAKSRLMFSVNEIAIAEKSDKWSKDVKTHSDLPEGTFEKSAKGIAKILKEKSDSLKQAMSRLNFYINRGGKNLSKEDKDKLENAKSKLRNLYNED